MSEFEDAVAGYREARASDLPLEAWKQIHAELRARFGDRGLEAIKRAARDPEPKMRVCPNCGKSFLMPVTAVGDRQHMGLCTGCYHQRKTLRQRGDGSQYWKDTTTRLGARKPFDAKPREHERED